ncbi:dihydrofolate reductase [Myxozyma melibiosi]|uniref:Dihydrofolate reductase n=1 Tax=Myxozyma melibiosi TaxID=54550 RepID=A0ABR1FF86_9ASCO
MTVPASSSARQLPITLVVAATHASLGIGRGGSLPWRLPTDMAFFRLVTSAPASDQTPHKPAVVMGRKTWDSLPAKFKPLPNRINIVLSRSKSSHGPGTHTFSSLSSAIEALSTQDPSSDLPAVSKIYIIGGAEIYAEALTHLSASRILLTTVHPADESTLDLDTFLPEFRTSGEWTQASHDDLRRYISEEVNSEEAAALLPESSGQRIKEKGLEFEFTLWERSQK